MKIAVIGGGPAGVTAAIQAAKNREVHLFDGNEKIGKKLFLTGKGRCNVTNASPIDEFFDHIVHNPEFLYSALYTYTNEDLMGRISRSVPLKTERGNRVFPVSDKSSDICNFLAGECEKAGVNIHLNERVLSVEKHEKFLLKTEKRTMEVDRLILATGGSSYQSTGSDGAGYGFAKSFGHTIIEPVGALVPVDLEHPFPDFAGLTLRNVELIVYSGKRKVWTEAGELLFTHFGISGPIVLTSVSRTNRMDNLSFFLDLKPALNPGQLDRSLLRTVDANLNKEAGTILKLRVPKVLAPELLRRTGIPEKLPGNEITKSMRRALGYELKHFKLGPGRPSDINGAIVTAGGIAVNEVNPSTMESKLVPGLYFAGELLDVDGLTGGYNLQIAFSTGYIAGQSAAE